MKERESERRLWTRPQPGWTSWASRVGAFFLSWEKILPAAQWKEGEEIEVGDTPTAGLALQQARCVAVCGKVLQ